MEQLIKDFWAVMVGFAGLVFWASKQESAIKSNADKISALSEQMRHEVEEIARMVAREIAALRAQRMEDQEMARESRTEVLSRLSRMDQDIKEILGMMKRTGGAG